MSGPAVAVHYVPAAAPGRSYNLILQGLRNHPRVRLADTVADSDLVIWHHQAWDTGLRLPADKLAFVDFHDDPYRVYPVDYRAYFKRSWPCPSTEAAFSMDVPARPPYMHPIAYAVMDEFLLPGEEPRDIDVACLLRPNQRKRTIILDFLHRVEWEDYRVLLGEVTSSSRDVFDWQYLTTLKRAKIVITCNPDDWEGDSRLWEALAAGALVFSDELHTPMPHPLRDGEHYIRFDPVGIDDDPMRLMPMLEALDRTLEQPAEIDRIARQGHAHALAHHRTVDRVKHILDTLGM